MPLGSYSFTTLFNERLKLVMGQLAVVFYSIWNEIASEFSTPNGVQIYNDYFLTSANIPQLHFGTKDYVED